MGISRFQPCTEEKNLGTKRKKRVSSKSGVFCSVHTLALRYKITFYDHTKITRTSWYFSMRLTMGNVVENWTHSLLYIFRIFLYFRWNPCTYLYSIFLFSNRLVPISRLSAGEWFDTTISHVRAKGTRSFVLYLLLEMVAAKKKSAGAAKLWSTTTNSDRKTVIPIEIGQPESIFGKVPRYQPRFRLRESHRYQNSNNFLERVIPSSIGEWHRV